jgi:hypothetical protein
VVGACLLRFNFVNPKAGYKAIAFVKERKGSRFERFSVQDQADFPYVHWIF